MKKGGFFSKFLETMGIMVETVEDNAYDGGQAYGQDDFDEQAEGQETVEFAQQAYEQPASYQPPASDVYANVQQEAQVRPAASDNTQKTRQSRAQKGNVINMHNQTAAQAQPMRAQAAPSMSVLVYRPSSFEDTQKIIDNVKSQRPVIVNLDALETDEAQRSLDFISGASYALNGTVFKVANSIFVLAPYNIDITGNIQNEMYPDTDDTYYEDALR